MEERTKIFNAVAHGIVMGWRRYELLSGIMEPGDSWEPQIKAALEKIANG